MQRTVITACVCSWHEAKQRCDVQDFAVEPDEQRMRKAAHLMVGSLAGSLALVTCRDPLRTSLTNRLRSLLAQGLDAAMLEQYVQVGAAFVCMLDQVHWQVFLLLPFSVSSHCCGSLRITTLHRITFAHCAVVPGLYQ